MTPTQSTSGPSQPTTPPAWPERVAALIPQTETHPFQVIARTYSLSLFLSLGPSLIPLVAKKSSKNALKRVLAREFGLTGFAFSITLAVGGGSVLRDLWRRLDDTLDLEAADTRATGTLKRWSACISSPYKTFLSHVLSSTAGLLLLQAGRRKRQSRSSRPSTSQTLDLTLLFVVRALDAAVQSFVARNSGSSRRDSDAALSLNRPRTAAERKRVRMRSQIDSLFFWACCARIMWCFFYEPQRLPKSYVKWINTLARVDPRLLEALRAIRSQKWSYRTGSPTHQNLLTTYAQELGHPASWGDPTLLPAYGGAHADKIWKSLGVTTRPGVGGLPCQVVHGKVGSSLGLQHSCTANAGLRGSKALVEAIAIYLPVQFLPILLSRPSSLLDPGRVLEALVGALRSATFLSAFVASYWYSVCFTRTLFLAKLFPSISHDFWDGPLGGVLAGSLLCGSSIWIENGRRRGEMALYVLPRAVRSLLPNSWVRTNSLYAVMGERIAFVLSLSALLTAANHHPHILRGLSRWGIRFVVNGPDVVFWRRQDPPKQESA
ncbi:hypothetical protein FB45DRAFT_552499 [Roridomyces roridus]|uniref:Transmembrane protein 135 N-terminal domain-containing protein n=1 Tax=Roridomyces roridus TaxID=1738132 RepID=A0AAD7BUD3_9AGAR|nr:hypothetical protein FB45DRAFT_552499 [Roridomyces roridus]